MMDMIASQLLAPMNPIPVMVSSARASLSSKANITAPEIGHSHCQCGWRQLAIELYSPGLTALGTRGAGFSVSEFCGRGACSAPVIAIDALTFLAALAAEASLRHTRLATTPANTVPVT
jgi:hypothetical protein